MVQNIILQEFITDCAESIEYEEQEKVLDGRVFYLFWFIKA